MTHARRYPTMEIKPEWKVVLHLSKSPLLQDEQLDRDRELHGREPGSDVLPASKTRLRPGIQGFGKNQYIC